MKQTRQIILLLIITAFTYTGNAQEKELFIKYDLKDNTSFHETRIELRSNGQQTLTEIIYSMMTQSASFNKETGEVTKHGVSKKTEFSRYSFQDYSESQLFSEDITIGDFTIKEDMNLIGWKLTGNTDTILDYPCQEAKTQFRGRDYTAWFTSVLPFKAAPWKIHGLPGVVLKVKTDDDFWSAEATELQVREMTEEIKNPLANNESYSWEDFCKIYEKRFKKSLSNQKTRWAKMGRDLPKQLLNRPRIEIILEEYNRYGMRIDMQMGTAINLE